MRSPRGSWDNVLLGLVVAGVVALIAFVLAGTWMLAELLWTMAS